MYGHISRRSHGGNGGAKNEHNCTIGQGDTICILFLQNKDLRVEKYRKAIELEPRLTYPESERSKILAIPERIFS